MQSGYSTARTDWIINALILKKMITWFSWKWNTSKVYNSNAICPVWRGGFKLADCISFRWIRPTTNKGTRGMTYNCIWSWGSSVEALENVQFPFIAITPSSTLTQSRKICWVSIYGSNRSMWKLFIFYRIVCKKKKKTHKKGIHQRFKYNHT